MATHPAVTGARLRQSGRPAPPAARGAPLGAAPPAAPGPPPRCWGHPAPAHTCWGRGRAGGAGRGGSWRGCAASAGSSGRSLPSFPSSLPRLPERPEAAPAACAARSAGRRRRRPELPAPGAKQITVQSSGRLSEGNTHVPQAGYLETLSLPPALPGPLLPSVPSSAPSVSPPHPCGSASPLHRPLSLLPPSALSPCAGPGCPRLTLPFLPAQLAAPQARTRLTGASTSSMEQPSLRSLKVSTGVLRWGASPRLVAGGGTRFAGGRGAVAEHGSRLGLWGPAGRRRWCMGPAQEGRWAGWGWPLVVCVCQASCKCLHWFCFGFLGEAGFCSWRPRWHPSSWPWHLWLLL